MATTDAAELRRQKILLNGEKRLEMLLGIFSVLNWITSATMEVLLLKYQMLFDSFDGLLHLKNKKFILKTVKRIRDDHLWHHSE